MTDLYTAARNVAAATPPPVRFLHEEAEQDEAFYAALLVLRDVIANMSVHDLGEYVCGEHNVRYLANDPAHTALRDEHEAFHKHLHGDRAGSFELAMRSVRGAR